MPRAALCDPLSPDILDGIEDVAIFLMSRCDVAEERSSPVEILELSPSNQFSINLASLWNVQDHDDDSTLTHDVFGGLEHGGDSARFAVDHEQQHIAHLFRFRFELDQIGMPAAITQRTAAAAQCAPASSIVSLLLSPALSSAASLPNLI